MVLFLSHSQRGCGGTCFVTSNLLLNRISDFKELLMKKMIQEFIDLFYI